MHYNTIILLICKIKIHYTYDSELAVMSGEFGCIATDIEVHHNKSLQWKAFCQLCDVTIKRIAHIEDTNCVAMSWIFPIAS